MTSEMMSERRVRLLHPHSGIGRQQYLNRLLGKRTEQPSNRGRLVHLPHHQHRIKFAKGCAMVFALDLGQKVRGLLKLFRSAGNTFDAISKHREDFWLSLKRLPAAVTSKPCS
jgi:hypothetical protein